MAERQALCDAIHIRLMHSSGAPKTTPAFRALGLEQMAFARARAQNLATGGYFEPLGHRLFGFDAFGTSHK
jgi:hypothetical protein